MEQDKIDAKTRELYIQAWSDQVKVIHLQLLHDLIMSGLTHPEIDSYVNKLNLARDTFYECIRDIGETLHQ